MFIGDDLALLIKLLRFAILVNRLLKRNEATDLLSGLILISFFLS